MKTVIYISSSSIQIIEGKVKKKTAVVSEEFSCALPDDCIVAGKITDEDAFSGFLRDILTENGFSAKEATLVIYNRFVSVAKIEMPVANEKNSYAFIEREYNKYGNNTQNVYGYIPLWTDQKAKLTNVMASRIEQEELETYIRVFSAAGIRLSRIQAALPGVIVQIMEHPEIKDTTCIVQIAENQFVTNILFIDGKYNYSNTTRIADEPGTVGYAIAVGRAVSNILQFMQANSIACENLQVFLAGMTPDDVMNCTDSIYQMNSELEVRELDLRAVVDNPQSPVMDTLYAGCGLIDKTHTADFFRVWKSAQKKAKKNERVQKAVKPIIILTVILTIVTLAMGVLVFVTDNRLNDVIEYNESRLAMTQQYDQMHRQALANEKEYKAVKELKENIESYPVADSYVESVVNRVAADSVTVQILSFDSASGVLSIDTRASDVDKINVFIQNLRMQDIFENIDYTGYTYIEADDCWQINVICYLSENAGKE